MVRNEIELLIAFYLKLEPFYILGDVTRVWVGFNAFYIMCESITCQIIQYCI